MIGASSSDHTRNGALFHRRPIILLNWGHRQMQKPGRGRPRGNFIERRKTGIAFIDMLKKAGGVKYAEAHLGLLMYADSPHCPYCECEVAEDLARSWMRRVHENTEAVFGGGDGVRGYDGRGKQKIRLSGKGRAGERANVRIRRTS